MNPDLLFHFFLRLSFIIFNPKMLLQLLVVVTVIVCMLLQDVRFVIMSW